MIHHLSASRGSSLNDFIPKDEYSLHYSTVDDAIGSLLQLGVGALMAKIDLQSAFRMVPVRRTDWELLGIHWQNHYYIDTCLPFGLRSAPYLFNQFAMALHWILQTNYDMPHLIHYLDDYLIMEQPDSPRCARKVESFLHVSELLGIPVALAELDRWSAPRKTTKRKLLSLRGLLSFAARALPVPPHTRFNPRFHPSASHVELHHRYYTFYLPHSKTDQLHRGHTIRLTSTTPGMICPVRHMRAYLKTRPSTRGPLYTFSDGHPLTRHLSFIIFAPHCGTLAAI